MHILAGAVALFFLYAASFKVANSSSLEATLGELGLPETVAGVCARLVPVFEIVLGLTVLGLAPAPVGPVLVLVAAAGIGGAGVVALRSDSDIRCSCFSAYSSAMLGLRQVLTALVLAGIAGVLFVDPPRFEIGETFRWLTVVSLLATAIHAAGAGRDVKASIGYRRAAASVYPA